MRYSPLALANTLEPEWHEGVTKGARAPRASREPVFTALRENRGQERAGGSRLRESQGEGVVVERQEVPDSGSRPAQRALLAEGISQHSCPVTHQDAPP